MKYKLKPGDLVWVWKDDPAEELAIITDINDIGDVWVFIVRDYDGQYDNLTGKLMMRWWKNITLVQST